MSEEGIVFRWVSWKVVDVEAIPLGVLPEGDLGKERVSHVKRGNPQESPNTPPPVFTVFHEPIWWPWLLHLVCDVGTARSSWLG